MIASAVSAVSGNYIIFGCYDYKEHKCLEVGLQKKYQERSALGEVST